MTHSITRRKYNNYKFSHLRITNKVGIQLFGEYLYTDFVPLLRKYEKYLQIIK